MDSKKIQPAVGKITVLCQNHCKLWLFSQSSIRTPAAVGMELNPNSEYSGTQLQGSQTHMDQLLLFIWLAELYTHFDWFLYQNMVSSSMAHSTVPHFFVLCTIWHELWSITQQTHNNTHNLFRKWNNHSIYNRIRKNH